MMQRIKITIMSLALVLGVGLVALPVGVSAADPPAPKKSTSQKAACDGLSEIDSSQSCDSGGADLTKVVAVVVNILSYIIGIAAVVMVLVSGFKYTTSGGDANRVGSAKTALIYALVGLFVAALAKVLVQFVLNQSAK